MTNLRARIADDWPWQVLILGMLVGLLSLLVFVAIVGAVVYLVANVS